MSLADETEKAYREAMREFLRAEIRKLGKPYNYAMLSREELTRLLAAI